MSTWGWLAVALGSATAASLVAGCGLSGETSSTDGGARGDGSRRDGMGAGDNAPGDGPGLDGTSAPDAIGGMDAHADAGPDAPAFDDAGCPALFGPMIRVNASGGTFCIDATEVTQGQYGVFQLSPAALVPMPAPCGWKTGHALGCVPKVGGLTEPAECVDWCDALAYCQFAGKGLCGKFDQSDVDFGNSDRTDPGKDVWQAACSHDGTLSFPYANAYMNGTCNLSDTAVGSYPVAVATYSQCVGGYPGIFDMSGNVQELENSCDLMGGSGAASDPCSVRGGSFRDAVGYMGCAGMTPGWTRGSTADDVGFRCCAP